MKELDVDYLLFVDRHDDKVLLEDVDLLRPLLDAVVALLRRRQVLQGNQTRLFR